jgi:hypothetical protein
MSVVVAAIAKAYHYLGGRGGHAQPALCAKLPDGSALEPCIESRLKR